MTWPTPEYIVRKPCNKVNATMSLQRRNSGGFFGRLTVTQRSQHECDLQCALKPHQTSAISEKSLRLVYVLETAHTISVSISIAICTFSYGLGLSKCL